MSYSPVTYTGDGVTTNFTVPFSYLSEDEVIVTVDGVSTSVTFVSSSIIQISPAPASGAIVYIKRDTDDDSQIVIWNNAVALTSQQLNTAVNQLFYLTQEAKAVVADTISKNYSGNFDAQSQKIINLATPTDNTDAANKEYVDDQYSEIVDTITALKDEAATSASAAATSASNAAASWDEFDDVYLGSKTSDPTLDNDGDPLAEGALYWNSANKRFRVYNGTDWEDATNTVNRDVYKFTATAGQTVFSGTDDGGQTLDLTDTFYAVYLNGVRLIDVDDYTKSDSAITLTSGVLAGDELIVEAYTQFSVADVVRKTGDTMSGDLNMGGNALTQVASVNGGPISGLRNKIINGGFEISQRTGPFTSQDYTVDRWACNFGGGAATLTQREFSAGHTDIPGNAKNYLEFNLTSTGVGTAHIEQRIEDVRRLSGKKVTLTFYARCSSSTTLYAKVNQNFGSGGSSTVECVDQSFSGSTSFTKHQVVFTMPSVSGKTLGTDHFIQLYLYFSAGATVTIDFARVSLVEGDASNEDDPFEERPEALERLLCQRYGYRVKNNGVNSLYGVIALAYTSIRAFAQITMPVTPRAAPSITNTSSSLLPATLSSSVTVTSLSVFQTAGDIVCLDIDVASGLVAGDAYHLNLVDIFLDMEL